MAASLLNPELIELLERLSVARVDLTQDRTGDVGRPRRADLGVDFSDYAAFQPGLDLRHVDWSVYGRTGRLVVKAYEARSDQPVCVLVDVSDSMALGNPPRLERARSLAACLAYVSLVGYHPLRIIAFAKDRLEVLPHRMGREAIHETLRFLEGLRAGGETSLAAGVAAGLEGVSRKAGRVFLISDFLDPAGLAPAFDLLATTRRRMDLLLLGDTLDGELPQGDIEAEDPETGQRRTLDVSAELASEYRSAVLEQRAEVARRARSVEAILHQLPPALSLQDAILRVLG